MLRKLLVLSLLAFPTAALADKADADACAKDLKGEPLKTYRAGVVYVVNGSTLEQAIRNVLEPKFNAGQITEAEGRDIGRQAAECMRLVHRK